MTAEPLAEWNEEARADRRRLLEADLAGGPVHELRVKELVEELADLYGEAQKTATLEALGHDEPRGPLEQDGETNMGSKASAMLRMLRGVIDLVSRTDPTGAVIRIRNTPLRIVGVLSRKGQAAMGQDQDDTVIAPYTTCSAARPPSMPTMRARRYASG